MNEIPEEIFFRIFSFVNLRAFFVQLPFVSKKFNALVRIPTACEPFFERYFPDSRQKAESQKREECYAYLSKLYRQHRSRLSREQRKALAYMLEDKIETLKMLVNSQDMPLRDLFDARIVTFAVARNNSDTLAYLYGVIEKNYLPKNKIIFAKSLLHWAVSLNSEIKKIETLIKTSPDKTIQECEILFDYIGKTGRLDLLEVVSKRFSLKKTQKERVLKAAIAHSQLDIIDFLLRDDQDLINSQINYYKKHEKLILGPALNINLTIFQFAAGCANLDVLIHLINKKDVNKDVNMVVELNTAIYIASVEGHFKVVKYLLGLKHDNNFGPAEYHPLLAVAKYGHITLVKYFIEERKLDCDVVYDYSKATRESSTRTLLDVAIEYEQLDIVRYLWAKKAKTAQSRFLHRAIVLEALNIVRNFIEETPDIDVNEVDEKGWTPLHYAAKREKGYSAVLLRRQECVINPRTPDGLTPAFIALRAGYCENFHFLLNKKNAKEQILDIDDEGNTLLHTAVLLIDAQNIYYIFELMNKAIKNLIEKNGANVNARNHLGKTPLFLLVEKAAIVGHFDKVFPLTKYLVEKGAVPNAIANDGKSVLNAAIVSGCSELVRYFVSEKKVTIQLSDISTAIKIIGPEIMAAEKMTYELLLAAIRDNQIELVKYCIEQRVPLSNQHYCTTSLHFAAQCGKVEIFKYLLQNGNIFVNRCDLQMVYNAGFPEITKILINVVQGDQTFLLMAILENNVELVCNYISAGAEVNLAANGLTPLQAAWYIGNTQIIQLLKSSGAVDVLAPSVPVNTAPQPQSTGKRPAAQLTQFFLPDAKRRKTTPESNAQAPRPNVAEAERHQPRL